MADFKINNFFGGVNKSVDPTLLQPNTASDAQNCDVSFGTLKRHKGTSRYVETNLGSNIATLMKYFQANNGTVWVTSAGKIYKLTGTAFTQIDSGFANDSFDYINFYDKTKDVLIYGNGVDNTKWYDGITVTNLKNRRAVFDSNGAVTGYYDANGTYCATEAAVTTLAPKGKFMELHYQRLWITGDAANPDRVYFSAFTTNGADAQDWTAPITEGEANQHGGFIDVKTWDGSRIVGMKVAFNDILIFKNKSIHKIFGSYPGNYEVVPLFNSNGAIADKSVVTSGSLMFFLNVDGVYAYDGTNCVLMPQFTEIVKTLNLSYIDKAVGVLYDNKYILAVPEGSSTVNNLILEYDLNTKSVMLIRGITVSSFMEFSNQLLYVSGDGYVRQYASGSTLDGTAMVSYWLTGKHDLGAKNAIKNSDMLYFYGSGSGDVVVSLITDKKTVQKTITLSSTETMIRTRLQNRGRWMQLKFENVNGSDFTIKSPQLIVELDYD